MNVPYKIPLAVSTDGIAVNLGIQEPQSVDLSMSVGVYAQVGNLQTKEKAYTPTTTPQTDTITADEGFDGIDTVNISIDAVQAGAMMLAESYDVSPEIEINNAGKITARHNSTGSIAPVTDSGWLDAGGNVTLYFYGECEKQLPTQGATTITPTESAQTAVTSGKYTTGVVDVAGIPSNYVGSAVERKEATDMTASGATVTAPSGYYASNATKTISTGSATPPEVMATDAAITTNGTSRITLSKIISLTPTVTPGYIASGTAANRNVILTANVPVLSATTYNASPTDQTISAGTYIYGTQTIKGYSNQTKTFTANGTYTPDAGYNGFDSVTVNVSGGGGKNVQVLQSTTRTTSTSYTKLCGDITVAKTGTYDVYWTGFRSSTSGTWGTQLYIGSTAYGTAQTTYSNHVQTVHLSNVSLTANQKVSVYGRSRGSNYYAYVGMLTIIEA